jgi:hypothetical protein
MVCEKSIEPLELAISAGNLSALFIAFFIVFYSIHPQSQQTFPCPSTIVSVASCLFLICIQYSSTMSPVQVSSSMSLPYTAQFTTLSVIRCPYCAQLRPSLHISMTSTGDHESSFDLALSDQNTDLLRAEDLLRG